MFFNTTNESIESLQVSEYILPREVISILDIELLNQFLLEFEDTLTKSTEPETEPVTDTRDSITSGVGELEVEDQSKLQDQDPTQELELELLSPSPLGILTPESIPEPSVIAQGDIPLLAPAGSEPQEEEGEEPSEGAFLPPALQSNLDPNRATDSIIQELSEYTDHLPVPPIVVDKVDRAQTNQQDDPGLSRRIHHR